MGDSTISLLGHLDALKKQHGNTSNASKILAALVNDNKTYKVPFKNFIDVANFLTPIIQTQIQKSDNNFKLDLLKASDPEQISPAFERIYYTSLSGIEPTEKDLMIRDIVITVLGMGLKQKREQKVITIGDIVMKNPGITPEGISSVQAHLQRGKTLNQASQFYSEQRQLSTSSYWKRFKMGYGIFS